jgi:hypothetical protein
MPSIMRWGLVIGGGDWDLHRMGDKSPKSKEKGLKQKDVAKGAGAVAAKSKQDHYSHVQAPVLKGKR